MNQTLCSLFVMVFGFNVAHGQSDGAPRVTDVVVSGSNSVHSLYSFDLVDGGGSQVRTIPVGGADTLAITLNEGANIQADHLTYVGLTTAHRPAVSNSFYDIAARTFVWQFSRPLAADLYAVRLRQLVTDVDGHALDGEWTNPRTLSTTSVAVSEFPSGNGIAGGDFVFVMNILPGDTSWDNRVNGSDDRIYGPYATWEEGDTNCDGVVNRSMRTFA